MIFVKPPSESPVDQGDLIDGCPILRVKSFQPGQSNPVEADFDFGQVIVVTQTCDLVNEKTTASNVAEVFPAQQLVDQRLLTPAEIKGPVRSGCVWGWYFLPAQPDLGLAEMLVDLRRLHTIPCDVLRTLCQAGKRRARLPTPYREHLAKHFADTFSRIGLPRPYETL